MSKKSFGPVILISLGLLFIATIGFRTISTPEIWTHLAQGRLNQPLSFLACDNIVNTTWLYDKLAYTAWNIGGGPNLLILLNIAGLIATFMLLLQVAKKWGGPLSQGFALLIAGHLMFQSIEVGPQVMMMLFIALTLYLVNTIRKPAILFATLVPLQILWTNMHGSFIYGPLIAALSAIQAAQQNKGASRTRKKQGIDAGMFGILAGAMLLATVANPYLFKLHGQVIANLKSSAPAYWSSLFIDYFQIPAIKPLVLFVVILGAGGLITLKKKLPVTLTSIAIYGAFLVIGASARMYLLFAVLAFPFIVLSLTAISEYIQTTLEHMMGDKAKLLVPATGTILALLIILSMIPIASNCAYTRMGSASNFGLGIQEEMYPCDAEALLKDPAFPAPEKTINLAADGGYLAFKYGRKIFIDYRPGRYNKALLEDLNALMLGNRTAYDTIMEEYHPEAFIINTLYPSSAQGIITLLSTGAWRLAYLDGTTAILLVNKPQYSSILNNKELQAAGLAKLEKARADYATVAGSCSAGNPAELIGSGKVFLAFNRVKESKAIFALLLQNNDRIPGAWMGLGTSQLYLKEFEAAAASLKTATKYAPQSDKAWKKYGDACEICSVRLKDQAKREAYKAEAEMARKKAEQLAEKAKKKQKEPEPEPEEAPKPEAPKSLHDIAVPEGQ